MTEVELLQKEIRSLIKRVAHLVRVNKRQREQIEKLRRELHPDRQYYVNVQKGRADSRRKGR